ncbi:amino acid adenylation domain-containing protein [Streptomyces sp. CA-210063]|uniref:non-ribosomal peptide synthetase n=1 Tax=Streptomyces sp. CA-210063 TaxID=2801029 RepID=UPI00214B1A04|nr:non-ribosomal peptide synthetase [Streptomyces sp. CA-210063]UUU28514.1 amino acid adenylation domain-containing protein [Streptomyces sp. CA-210063]
MSPALRDVLAAVASGELPDEIAESLLRGLTAPAPEPGPYPLSRGQAALWAIHASRPGTTSYNLPLGLWLGDGIDPDVLTRALIAVVERQPGLRIAVRLDGTTPVQEITERPAEVVRLDLGHVTDGEFAARIRRLVHTPFDLEHDPLHRMWLIAAPGGRTLLLLVFHHMITDGISSHLLLRDIVACHDALAGRGVLPPVEPATSYREFVRRQQELLDGPEAEKHRRWWLDRLAGASSGPVLDAITDRHRVEPPTADTGAMVQFRLPEATWAALRQVAGAAGLTPFSVLLGSFAALLHRHSGHRDISVMVPTDGRISERFDRTVGYLINPVVVRVDCDPQRSLAELMTAVHDHMAQAEEHSSYPFAAVVGDLRRAGGAAVSFDIGFYLQQGVGGDQDMAAGQTVFQDALELTQEGENPLVVEVVVRGSEALVYLKYDRDLFDPATAERLAEHYRLLLESVAADPRRPIGDLPLITAAERALVDRANDTRAARPRDVTAAGLVLARAASAPERVAVVDADGAISYGELARRVHALARTLGESGVGRGDLVGVLSGRRAAMIVAMLAAHTAGAAYVTLDPGFPAARLAHICTDAGLAAVLVDPAYADRLPAGTPGARIPLGDPGDAAPGSPVACHDDDLAYVLYTSGSTGRPKGVEVTHGNLVNFLTAMANRPGCAADDVLLAVTTAGFDIAGLELLLPLTQGATVHIAPAEVTRDGFALAGLLDSSGATIVQATPATWQMLLAAGWSGRVPRLLCGGEALSAELAADLLDRSGELWNMYGPTETTIWSSALRVRRDRPITVGTPIANTTFHLAGPDGGPVPFGATGELLIGGDGVARGYRGRPELNAERFVEQDGQRRYRTGDLARWTETGELLLLGRADRQIKLRGHRIELGEIEAAIRRTGATGEARVVLREERPGHPRLVAFVVAEPAPAATIAGRIEEWLPAYMIPSRTVPMTGLPMTPNAKVDAVRLATASLDELIREFGHAERPREPRPSDSGRLLATLRELTAGVAGVAPQDIPVDRPLGEAGFDSVGFTRLAMAVRTRFGVPISPTLFYAHPALSSLAAHIGASSPDTFTETEAETEAEPEAETEAEPERARAAATVRASGPAVPPEDLGYPPVAIIGVGGRLPASGSLHEFWTHLAEGRDLTAPYPLERGFSARVFPERFRGSFVRDVDAFDAGRFRISPREAAQMDPQHRLLLHAADEALLDAGLVPAALAGSRTGVFVGLSGADYLGLLGPGSPEMGDHFLIGNVASIAANRISYVYDLHGPSAVYDTACSSSLVAIHRAARALHIGDCELALAGGANLLLSPHGFTGLRRAGMLSPDGRCKTFDERADGYGRGEGVVLLALKLLERAIAEGDPVHGVLIGSAENHGGHTHSLTVPNPQAQRDVLLAAHRAAAVPPDTIGYIEAHGTGTPLGDPIEVDALREAFGQLYRDWGLHVVAGRTGLGSVKSNIGHLEAAAGVAGVVKVLLSMRHRLMPGLAGLGTPNPMIDLAGSPFRLQAEAQPWEPPDGMPARAGVSSFGMGGSNVHVVVAEAEKH